MSWINGRFTRVALNNLETMKSENITQNKVRKIHDFFSHAARATDILHWKIEEGSVTTKEACDQITRMLEELKQLTK